MRKYLFIEGTDDLSNGNLREGFHKLLEKEIGGRMPTIAMSGGKSQSIGKFKNSKESKLLCDLDAAKSEIEKDLEDNELKELRESVFYMIQEMEGWFLSQPEILDKFYNFKVSGKLAKKHGDQFSHPDEELMRVTKDSKKGQYHKVNHGVELLKLLDTKKLMTDFPEFKRLIDSF